AGRRAEADRLPAPPVPPRRQPRRRPPRPLRLRPRRPLDVRPPAPDARPGALSVEPRDGAATARHGAETIVVSRSGGCPAARSPLLHVLAGRRQELRPPCPRSPRSTSL